MKKVFLALCIVLISQTLRAANDSERAIIPLGGNAWTTGKAVITDDGLTNWANASSVTSIYFRVSNAQQLNLSLRIRVPAGKSTLNITVGKSSFTKQFANTAFDTISIGKITAQPGYVKVDIKGISKTAGVYANVSDLIVDGINTDNELTYVKYGSSFYFGKRGPSVHLNYAVPADLKTDAQWFYSEITVPQKMDVIGSYYMADGFKEGYFGMQVNSATERRVLFSVWSPFTTDDPKSIPDSLKIKLISKGTGVHAGEFGNEGSGGQSYMQYNWQAGKSYGFLLKAEPNKANNTTTYTAWFKDIAAGKWMLVASFNRPQTLTYLKSFHSFLENFEPDNGDKVRMAYYTNQWLGDTEGQWHQITGIRYTGDETARKNYRKDYAGGINNGKFFLKNGGFFNDLVPLNETFKLNTVNKPPSINLKELPR